ncbi:MAG: adenosylmethionine--8-amino-7-oxononanoate transaminase [Flavobacterium sp. BFFFF2]|nr:MAG: adenosylmethionine--8-amino-7-oxononanoate transaminase [Flavobacterium sp. BFFFF2]
MSLSAIDQQHIWHPYTQHQTCGPLPVLVKGKGIYLWDENEKKYIDGISSWWCNPFGHANEDLASAMFQQASTLEHVLFGGFTHKPAIELVEKLLPLLPSNQKKIFFSDNGSTAVEVALKAALQFFHNQGIKKNKIIAFEDAFHGDTFGAMASSGIGLFTEAFKESLLQVIRIPVPVKGQEDKAFSALKVALEDEGVAAFIFEPLCQGAAGMIMYEAPILDQFIDVCQKAGVLTIADEVMTGFWKTGRCFASDYLTHKPDIICLSKALTGGTLPMAITTFTQAIFDGFLSSDPGIALLHGHTFTANPTACAVAKKALELLENPEMQQGIDFIHQKHLVFKEKWKHDLRVENIRVLGVILAFDMVRPDKEAYYGNFRNQLYAFFIENGLLLRPIGNTIYILPPFIINDEELNKVYSLLEEAIDKFS